MSTTVITLPEQPNPDILSYLTLLYGNFKDGYLNIRYQQKGKSMQNYYLDLSNNIDYNAKLLTLYTMQDSEVFVAVCPKLTKEGTKKAIMAIPALWVDIDAAEYTLPRDIPEPTIVVNSGRGRHLYWVFSEPYYLPLAVNERTKAVKAYERLLAVLAKKLGGDLKACDLSRILRLPGSNNYKEDTILTAKIITEESSGALYTLEDFAKFTDDFVEYQPKLLPGVAEKLTDEQILEIVFPEQFRTALIEAWQEGRRHQLALGLAGYLRKANVSKELALQIMQYVAQEALDPEINDRLKAVETTYEKPLEKVAGITLLLAHGVEPPRVMPGADGGKKVKEVLPTIPIDTDLIVPAPNYRLSMAGIEKLNGDGLAVRVCNSPIVLTRKLYSIDDGIEEVEIMFYHNNEWDKVIVPREIAFDHRRLTQIAGTGLPVTSINARAIVEYLTAFEFSNPGIPSEYVFTRNGWKQNKSFFVCGESLINDGGEIIVKEDKQFNLSGGELQAIKALRREGSKDEWLAIIQRIIATYPKVAFAIYASCVPPLISIINGSNFAIDYAGKSTTGKTTTMEIASSVWGDPDSLIRNFDSTRVFHERYASIMGDLPIFLDETQLIRDKHQQEAILYTLVNGVGKGRGRISGTQKTYTWNTVVFTTGELPLINSQSKDGMRARSIAFWGSPFGVVSQETARFIYEVNKVIKTNYGHAGVELVAHLMQFKTMYENYINIYNELADKFAEMLTIARKPFATRVNKYYAQVALAGIIFNDIFGIKDVDVVKMIADDIIQIQPILDESNISSTMLNEISNFIASNSKHFVGSTEYLPGNEIFGVINDDYIGITTTQLQKLARELGVTQDALVIYMKEQELTDGKVHRVMALSSKVSVIKFDKRILE
jgi:hypothetical protein